MPHTRQWYGKQMHKNIQICAIGATECQDNWASLRSEAILVRIAGNGRHLSSAVVFLHQDRDGWWWNDGFKVTSSHFQMLNISTTWLLVDVGWCCLYILYILFSVAHSRLSGYIRYISMACCCNSRCFPQFATKNGREWQLICRT